MIKEFVQAWDKNKRELEAYFRNPENKHYYSYEELVKLLFEIVINPELCDPYDIEHMHVIDDGDYQGTQVFLLFRDTYQPNAEEYVYTNSYYGSCSHCDALQGILDCEGDGSDSFTELQVKDLMTLCMHLMQKCRQMEDPVEKGEYEFEWELNADKWVDAFIEAGKMEFY